MLIRDVIKQAFEDVDEGAAGQKSRTVPRGDLDTLLQKVTGLKEDQRQVVLNYFDSSNQGYVNYDNFVAWLFATADADYAEALTPLEEKLIKERAAAASLKGAQQQQQPQQVPVADAASKVPIFDANSPQDGAAKKGAADPRRQDTKGEAEAAEAAKRADLERQAKLKQQESDKLAKKDDRLDRLLDGKSKTTSPAATPPAKPSAKTTRTIVLKLEDGKTGMVFLSQAPERVFIKEVKPGMWAEKIGVKVGDEIVSFGGVVLEGMKKEEFAATLKEGGPRPLTIVVASP